MICSKYSKIKLSSDNSDRPVSFRPADGGIPGSNKGAGRVHPASGGRVHPASGGSECIRKEGRQPQGRKGRSFLALLHFTVQLPGEVSGTPAPRRSGPHQAPPLLSARGRLGSLSHLPTCLLPSSEVIMPRGRNSKHRARERRHQAQVEPQNLGLQRATSTSTESIQRGHIDEKVVIMVYYLLYKYNMKELISKAEMLREVIQMYRNHYLEILQRAAEHMEMIFGLDMKEVDPYRHIYILVNKMEVSCDARLLNRIEIPKTGLLMAVLGVIFMHGNCVSEERVWQTLNVMGLFSGRKHFIFGEPKKLITKDLVQQKYLEYRQVANSDPPCYEFLWGSRAHAETTKMKVLEFTAKIHNMVPTAFPSLYEEALRDEEERARARASAKARIAALAKARSSAIASSCSRFKRV
ncbi:melanoma-associated antigen B10 [Bubalus bubalis]|uniref:melanoma-associated antigen B10 n=1 Tax=Bubalus bubalis TaxID=89462 RepID=UPI001E1B7990|nr:melanoma-associated antigen B10 [Bubalus bubalis]